MVRAVVKYLAGVEEVELNLDGPYAPPVPRGPVVSVQRGAAKLRKVVEAVRILKGREGMEVHVRAGEWLDMDVVEAALKEDESLE